MERLSRRLNMSRVLRGALLFGFCLASADFAAADEAVADKTTAPDNAAASLQEVIVTAERREENLQRVPVAVTALTADELVANRIESVRDLNALAPSLTVVSPPGGVANLLLSMRGSPASAPCPALIPVLPLM
jgi:iron complex outermembrane receptor protein